MSNLSKAHHPQFPSNKTTSHNPFHGAAQTEIYDYLRRFLPVLEHLIVITMGKSNAKAPRNGQQILGVDEGTKINLLGSSQKWRWIPNILTSQAGLPLRVDGKIS